jgi:hypothetical protein
VKKCLISLLILLIASPVWAIDPEALTAEAFAQAGLDTENSAQIKLNEKMVEVFIELFPKYQAIANDFDMREEPEISANWVAEQKKGLDRVLAKKNVSFEQFTKITEKVSLAFSMLQAQAHGISPEQFGFGTSFQVSEEELSTIKKYEGQLKKVFEMAGAGE